MAAASPGRHERATDTCVPVSELAGAVAFARAEVERLGLDAAILGHAGDGNLHVSLQLDPDDEPEIALADELFESWSPMRSRVAAPVPASTASAWARSRHSSSNTAISSR